MATSSLSPASVFLAFLMTEAGAAGITQEEMAEVLQLPSGPQHAAAGALTDLLQSGDGPTIQIANRIWVEGSWMDRLQEEFQTTLREAYNAEAGVAPFVTNPDAAREEINAWVAEQTQGQGHRVAPRRKHRLPGATRAHEHSLLPRFVGDRVQCREYRGGPVRNAVWERLGPNDEPSDELPVPRDRLRGSSVEMPYAGEEWSMIAVLPKGRRGS